MWLLNGDDGCEDGDGCEDKFEGVIKDESVFEIEVVVEVVEGGCVMVIMLLLFLFLEIIFSNLELFFCFLWW